MWKRIGKNGNKYWGSRAAGIFFTDGKKVLLLKRSEKGDNEGTWGLPGGKVEEKETLIDAARREAKEECGKIEGYRFEDLKEKDGMHDWTTFFFKVKSTFKCKLSDEHKEYKWVDLESVKGCELHPQFKKNLDRHLNVIKNAKKKGIFGFKEWIDIKEN
jgi:8-oxo-dGTP pyrophosphatase MutT (NUDIX family)